MKNIVILPAKNNEFDKWVSNDVPDIFLLRRYSKNELSRIRQEFKGKFRAFYIDPAYKSIYESILPGETLLIFLDIESSVVVRIGTVAQKKYDPELARILWPTEWPEMRANILFMNGIFRPIAAGLIKFVNKNGETSGTISSPIILQANKINKRYGSTQAFVDYLGGYASTDGECKQRVHLIKTEAPPEEEISNDAENFEDNKNSTSSFDKPTEAATASISDEEKIEEKPPKTHKPLSLSEKLNVQLSKWKSELINLDRRNRLLYYRPTKASTVEFSEPSASVILDRLYAPRSKGVKITHSSENKQIALYSKTINPNEARSSESQSDKLKKCLFNLERKASQLWLDRGIWSLYLGSGVLEWKENSNTESEIIKTPILMVPVELDHAGGDEDFRIQKTDEEMALNPALVAKLKLDFNIDLTIDEDIEEGDHKGIIENVRKKIANKGWRILDTAVLTTFTFHKHAMYKDLDINASTVCSNPIIRALVLGKESGHDFDFESISQDDLDQKAPPEYMVTILDADSSQRQAIVAAGEGKSFVLDGPPGTGKSQTIANIIAELISKKKSVLFVSEKAAALEVVKKRLDQAGLSDFILELHSHKATRKEVAKNLGLSLASQPVYFSPMTIMDKDTLKRSRLELLDWGTAVNEVRPDLGISLQEAIGCVASIAAQYDLPPGVSLPSNDRLILRARVRETSQALSQSWSPVERFEDFIWDRASINEWDASIRIRIIEKIDIARNSLEDIRSIGEKTAKNLKLSQPLDIDSLEALLRIEYLMEQRPQVSPDLLTNRDLIELEKEFTDLATRAKELEQACILLDVKAGSSWRMLSPNIGKKFSETLNSIKILDPGWLPPPNANAESLKYHQRFHEEYAERIKILSSAVDDFCAFFITMPGKQSISTARQLCDFGKNLVIKNWPQKFWIDKDWLDVFEDKYKEALTVVTETNKLAQSLAPFFSESVIQLDLESILSRFETYNFWRIFKKNYHNDMKALSVHSVKGAFKWRNRSAIKIAKDIKIMLHRLSTLEPLFREYFGSYWNSRETDFNAIVLAANLAQLGIKYFMKGFELAPIRSVLSGENPDILQQLAVLTETMTTELVTFDARVEIACPDCREFIEKIDLTLLPQHSNILCASYSTIASLLDEASFNCPEVKTISDLKIVALAREKVDIEELYFSKCAERFERDFLTAYKGSKSDWSELKTILEWTNEVRANLRDKLVQEVAEFLLTVDPSFTIFDQKLKTYNKALLSLNDEVDKGSRLGKRLTSSKIIENLRVLLNSMRDHIDEIPEAQSYYEMRNNLNTIGLSTAVDFAIKNKLPANTLVEFFDAAFLTPWIEELFKKDTRLRYSSSNQRNGILSSFQQLDKKYIKLSASAAIEACISLRPKDYRGGWATIKHQAGLQRRHKPVKKLMEEAGSEIRQLKPCFMMSPLSVSQFIPSFMKFDAVIFDEASQVKPADAINSIYRGGQLIVAGDQRQLPPTSFFEQSQDTDDDYVDDDEPNSWESILDLCTSSASFKEIQLLWHYRSRHEHLIAFSNQMFYDGRLVTFPGARHKGDDVGVEFFYVPNGQYRRNATRDNLHEAEKVRDRVLHHIEHNPNLTIGIVALSESQASLIEQILESSLSNRQDLRERMKRDRLGGLFIKNLETVQGDERDLIILSIGYGPDENGRLIQNFGPMNQQNGWRRLNVAITRARMRVEVIASIMPNQITDGNGLRSIKYLKKYLEYAAAGTERLKVVNNLFGSGNADRESPFEDSVAHAIVQMGYSVEPQHGCSGYRIDLVIRHPNDPTQFVLAVECDGARYHSVKVVRDRDRLRQEILKGLGWSVYRVWSSAWYWNRKEQERLLEEAIKKAVYLHPVQSLHEIDISEQVSTESNTNQNQQDQVIESGVDEYIEEVNSEKNSNIINLIPDNFPPLPKDISVSSLVQYLNAFGITVENYRELGGGIWVYLGEKDFGDLAIHLKKHGVSCRYYPEGRRNHPGKQFEIDPLKRLT